MARILRSAHEADLETVTGWLSDADAARIWGGPKIRFPLSVDSLLEDIPFTPETSFVLDDDQGVAAFGQILPRDHHRAHLARIIVNPRRRGAGIGRELCLRLMSETPIGQRAAEFTLNVYPENARAIALYQSLEFIARDDFIFMTRTAFGTERLRAERLTADHFALMRRLHSDPDVMAGLGGVKTEEDTAGYFERNLAHWEAHNHGVWMLFDRATGEHAGLGVVRHLDVDGIDEVEIGYAFHKPFWGHGLATEVARACIDFSFDRLGLPSIVAVTTPENVASQKVLAEVGLEHERDFRRGHEPLRLFRLSYLP
jgi:RimJ/RimL family protein N-acetyltransferase